MESCVLFSLINKILPRNFYSIERWKWNIISSNFLRWKLFPKNNYPNSNTKKIPKNLIYIKLFVTNNMFVILFTHVKIVYWKNRNKLTCSVNVESRLWVGIFNGCKRFTKKTYLNSQRSPDKHYRKLLGTTGASTNNTAFVIFYDNVSFYI